MTTGLRILGFLATLVAVFVVALGIGRATAPEQGDRRRGGHSECLGIDAGGAVAGPRLSITQEVGSTARKGER